MKKEKKRFEGWIPDIKELIGDKAWGGKCGCCHIWKHLVTQEVGCLTIEKNICVDCGRNQILILIDWNKK